jgi:predicted amidohydrolase
VLADLGNHELGAEQTDETDAVDIPTILDTKKNLDTCLESVKTAASSGARLVVFPEAALTGYCFATLEEAIPVAETIPGPSTEQVSALCQSLGAYVILGLIEKEGSRYHNTAAFLGPQGLVGKYRKLHLPYLGIDRFLNHGNLPLAVCDTEIGRVGMGICYDLAFPEHSRALALEGADIVVNITNWPGQTTDPNFTRLVHVRAYENSIYYIAVNRVGIENGWSFFGSSLAVDPLGKPVALAKEREEELFHVEIDPNVARRKHHIHIPGESELDRMRDRRPEFYGELVKPLEDKSRMR